jgi:hypothetical protein
MAIWVLFEESFSFQSPLNVFGRDFPIFDDAMSQYRRHSSMKEIQNTAVHPFPPNP